MYSFIISICALVLGYLLYGKFVEKVFGPDPARPTPAIAMKDGMDYVPMPAWKVYMIQFLNIAGTGPIFGAIMGAKFGPSAYLWIVFGCVFAGAVHDYLSGMLSMRHGGESLPDLIGEYLGKGAKTVMLIFTVILLVVVGAVFVYSPALILGDIAGDGSGTAVLIWAGAVFAYYVIATLLPVDKIIGKIYPIFAFAIIFMAISLMICLFVKWPTVPEIWQGLGNRGPSIGLNGQSIYPCLFITIACGAISGFHATQSPMMARCIKNEKMGRPVFYGAMITEGLVALVWATVASYFFFDGGAAEVGSELSAAAPTVVTKVASSWLGILGGVLAVLGVVAAPITSGDTALRSARLIVADFLKMEQKSPAKRLYISIPIFVVTALVLWFNIADESGFNVIWRYFGWANQTLSCFTLWMLTVWLALEGRKSWHYVIMFVPALFMTAVCLSFICVDKTGLGLPMQYAKWIAIATVAVCMTLFYTWKNRREARA